MQDDIIVHSPWLPVIAVGHVDQVRNVVAEVVEQRLAAHTRPPLRSHCLALLLRASSSPLAISRIPRSAATESGFDVARQQLRCRWQLAKADFSGKLADSLA
jgi:hypothetical protein